MTQYEQLPHLLRELPGPGLPTSNWSDTSGWRIAETLSEIVRREGADRIKSADMIAASLDECEGRMSLHVLIIDVDFQRPHIFVGLPDITKKPDANNLTQLFVDTLVQSADCTLSEIKRKLACIAADGAAVLQGELNDLIARVKQSYAVFVVGVHCAAHKLQLAAKDFEKDSLLVAVVSLLQAGYSFFSGSLNRPSFLKK
jgi:hypothetical protein